MDLTLPMSAMVAKLDAARLSVSTKGKRAALAAGGKVLKAEMQRQAPVLTKKQQGSNSLEPRALQEGMRVLITKDEDEPAALVGPAAKVEYVARFVEFGTHVAAANPFLRRAYEAKVAETVEAERASLAATIQKEVL